MTYQKVCDSGGPSLLELVFAIAVFGILLFLRLRSQGFVLHAALLALAPSTEDVVISIMLAEGLVQIAALTTLFLSAQVLAVRRRFTIRRARWNSPTA